MFSSSTQLKYWTFSGTTEITKLRTEANDEFICIHGGEFEEEYKKEFFLTLQEERDIFRHYEYVMKEFCTRFQPPMPKYVQGTSMLFYKRFYLHNSVMDYHPRDILYTCVYLACKVEEFNVSIQQFVSQVPGDGERTCDLILSQELLMMQQLHYHLTVHNPFRPFEGLMIDIKTRCLQVEEPERLRKVAEDFLDRSLHTDVSLIFAPSQIALAAILSSAGKQGINLDSYVTNSLVGSGNKENLTKTVEHIKRIRYMVKRLDSLNREEVRAIEQKLENCRNQENNPDSEVYKQKVEDLWEEDEDRRSKKRMKQAEKREKEDRETCGIATK